MLNKRYIKSMKRNIFCFDFLSSILVSFFFSAIYWKGIIRSGLPLQDGGSVDVLIF